MILRFGLLGERLGVKHPKYCTVVSLLRGLSVAWMAPESLGFCTLQRENQDAFSLPARSTSEQGDLHSVEEQFRGCGHVVYR